MVSSFFYILLVVIIAIAIIALILLVLLKKTDFSDLSQSAITQITNQVINQIEADGLYSTNHTAFVDQQFGSDSTGLVQRPDRPFKTAQGAMTAITAFRVATDTWTILMNNGIYGAINLRGFIVLACMNVGYSFIGPITTSIGSNEISYIIDMRVTNNPTTPDTPFASPAIIHNSGIVAIENSFLNCVISTDSGIGVVRSVIQKANGASFIFIKGQMQGSFLPRTVQNAANIDCLVYTNDTSIGSFQLLETVSLTLDSQMSLGTLVTFYSLSTAGNFISTSKLDCNATMTSGTPITAEYNIFRCDGDNQSVNSVRDNFNFQANAGTITSLTTKVSYSNNLNNGSILVMCPFLKVNQQTNMTILAQETVGLGTDSIIDASWVDYIGRPLSIPNNLINNGVDKLGASWGQGGYSQGIVRVTSSPYQIDSSIATLIIDIGGIITLPNGAETNGRILTFKNISAFIVSIQVDTISYPTQYIDPGSPVTMYVLGPGSNVTLQTEITALPSSSTWWIV